MLNTPEKPYSREEEYLANIAGEGTPVPEKAYSRKEAYLDAISGHVSGMASDISDLNQKVAALATDFSYKGSVATYADLPANPAIGDVYTTEDEGYMYVWDGNSWQILNMQGGGGGIPTLTKDDYNYPTTGTKTAIDITTIKPGYYQVGSEDIVIRNGAYNHTIKAGAWVAVTGEVGTTNYSLTYGGYGAAYSAGYQKAPTESILLTRGNLYTSAGNHADGPMTQKATTEMIFKDPNARRTVAIGSGSNADFFGTALGVDAKAMGRASVALAGSSTTAKGVFAVGLASGGSVLGTTDGYNNTAYRLITGLYDPQSDHDAATKGYVDTKVTMTTTDPGEGQPLAAGGLIGVYE